MKKIIVILVLTLVTINVFAQDFEIPGNYEFTTKEDYARYEADILKSIEWLTHTPVGTQPEKRLDVNAFLLKWLAGSPDVSVEIKTEIVNFIDPNPELLIIFICGWTKYSIETKDNKNKLTGNLKGIESVMDFYTRYKENMKKDKNVEKYIKMKEKGTLEEFIKKNV